MTREELEREIAAVASDIEILNQKIAEAIEYAKERDRLRKKMQELLFEYQAECFREKTEAHKAIFVYNGKTKNLLKALQQELEKAQKYNPPSF